MAIIKAAAGGTAVTVTDGETTVEDVTTLQVSGATVEGAAGVAELAIEAGGVEVIEDPGNVWEAGVAVTTGHRIAAVLPDTAGDSTPRVFEVVTGGTTQHGVPDGFADDQSGFLINLTPLGLTNDLNPVTWRYIGKVGEVP